MLYFGWLCHWRETVLSSSRALQGGKSSRAEFAPCTEQCIFNMMQVVICWFFFQAKMPSAVALPGPQLLCRCLRCMVSWGTEPGCAECHRLCPSASCYSHWITHPRTVIIIVVQYQLCSINRASCLEPIVLNYWCWETLPPSWPCLSCWNGAADRRKQFFSLSS